MKFGKIHDIGQVDFSLPDEPESNKTFLSANLATVEGDQLLLGCPVWADKSFIGKIGQLIIVCSFLNFFFIIISVCNISAIDENKIRFIVIS